MNEVWKVLSYSGRPKHTYRVSFAGSEELARAHFERAAARLERGAVFLLQDHTMKAYC
jgi:hypothetical protein